MPSADLFAPQSEEMIRRAMRETKRMARERQTREFDLAIDYLENRQLEDVRGELTTRYPRTQSGAAGQRIEPLCIPLTERYISEAANAYNKPVRRTLTTLEGEENEATKAATEELHAALEECSYDETMHRLEQLTVLLGSCGLWYQAKRGKLRPVVVFPHLINPVAPEDPSNFDECDQEDYQGFSMAVARGESNNSAATWCMLTRAEHIYYEARDPYEPDRILESYPNPFRFPQMVDTDDAKGRLLADAPLQMLTVWHRRKAIDDLLPDVDPEIVYLNRELNIQWSILFDTMRTQGWSQMWMQILNPEAPPTAISYGSRFVLPLAPGESIGSINAGNDYGGLVETLKSALRTFAMCKRMSPNDFAIDGSGPQSGFAKLVDSLPKLEARDERVRRLTAMEQRLSWPRIGSILKYLGKLSGDPSKLKLRVEYADVEFPRTVAEEAQAQEHDFKHGLSTPALVLAKRMGITEEQARELIDERKGQQPQAQPEGQQPQPEQPGSRLGLLIRQRKVDLAKAGAAEKPEKSGEKRGEKSGEKRGEK